MASGLLANTVQWQGSGRKMQRLQLIVSGCSAQDGYLGYLTISCQTSGGGAGREQDAISGVSADAVQSP